MPFTVWNPPERGKLMPAASEPPPLTRIMINIMMRYRIRNVIVILINMEISFHHYDSRVPGPMILLAVPSTWIISGNPDPESGLHSTVYPLSLNTVPCPSTVKAGSSLQSQTRCFWRAKTPPVLMIELHSPGCSCMI